MDLHICAVRLIDKITENLCVYVFIWMSTEKLDSEQRTVIIFMSKRCDSIFISDRIDAPVGWVGPESIALEPHIAYNIHREVLMTCRLASVNVRMFFKFMTTTCMYLVRVASVECWLLFCHHRCSCHVSSSSPVWNECFTSFGSWNNRLVYNRDGMYLRKMYVQMIIIFINRI